MNSESVGKPRHRTHDAYWPADLFDAGIGWIILARFKSGGKRVEAGIFLVDVFCLGVKLAVYEDQDAQTFQERILGHYQSEFEIKAVEPACARKLLEDSVQYARALGFGPHADFKKAARVFGGIRAEDCSQQFTFGKDGKPFYCRGPRETEEQALRIVRHLQKMRGEGNYNYLLRLGNPEEINRELE